MCAAKNTVSTFTVSHASNASLPRHFRSDLNQKGQQLTAKRDAQLRWGEAIGMIHEQTKSSKHNHFIMLAMLMREGQRHSRIAYPAAATSKLYTSTLWHTASNALSAFQAVSHDPYPEVLNEVTRAKLFHPELISALPSATVVAKK